MAPSGVPEFGAALIPVRVASPPQGMMLGRARVAAPSLTEYEHLIEEHGREPHEALFPRYARACEQRAEFCASEVLRIAMGGEQATVKTADGSLLVVLDPDGARQGRGPLRGHSRRLLRGA